LIVLKSDERTQVVACLSPSSDSIHWVGFSISVRPTEGWAFKKELTINMQKTGKKHFIGFSNFTAVKIDFLRLLNF
jgi:hypothetical protein